MIGFLEGRVAGFHADGCFLDVRGVGYKLTCSGATLSALQKHGETRVWTHTHVREDALALFGFATQGEQAMFEALLGVSGVGPKVALGLCGAFEPESFRRALATDDIAAIASVPGIGKKTAQRIVIDLKERWAVPDLGIVGASSDAVAKARSALENLGYSSGEVRIALNDLDVDEKESVEEVVRSALKVLAS